MSTFTVQFQEYKEKVKKDGEELVKNLLPRKVLELDKLFKSDEFSLSRLPTLTGDLNIPVPQVTDNGDEPCLKKMKHNDGEIAMPLRGTPVYSLPGGVVPANKNVIQLVEMVKPQIHELIDHANHIRMWIAYQIPKVEDGNNFGVSIQEDTLAEARQVEADAAMYLEKLTVYYMTRGKVVSKLAKYPHVDDYRRTVKELDQRQFFNLRLLVCELRNHYATLHDIIIKNMEKIQKPRSQNADNMY